jgi:hypothetical protein
LEYKLVKSLDELYMYAREKKTMEYCSSVKGWHRLASGVWLAKSLYVLQAIIDSEAVRVAVEEEPVVLVECIDMDGLSKWFLEASIPALWVAKQTGRFIKSYIQGEKDGRI